MNDPPFSAMFSAPSKNNDMFHTVHLPVKISRFTIIRQLCEPGRTTNNTVTKMYDIKSGNLLVERCAKIGLIDNVTRKPVPHPDW
jgi:hypothetical protein